MKTWSLNKSDLEMALGIIQHVPAKNGVVSSEYIKVEKADQGTVFSLCADLSAQAVLQDEFPFSKPLLIDRRLFEPFVNSGRELKGDTYTFAMKKKGILTIKHGSRVAVFSVYRKVSGYSDPPQFDDQALSMRVYESWSKIMQCAIACATDDPVTPQFNCVYVVPTGSKELLMYATNTKVIFKGRGTTKKPPKKPIAFPLILASKLEGLDMETVSWDDKSALIESERGHLWQAVKSAARKKFPVAELEKTITALKAGKPIMHVSSEELGLAAERMDMYLGAVSREDLVLNVTAEKDSLRAKLTAGTGDTVFTEYITLLKHARNDIDLHWPLDEVMPALEYAKNQGKAEIYATDNISMYVTDDLQLVIARIKK